MVVDDAAIAPDGGLAAAGEVVGAGDDRERLCPDPCRGRRVRVAKRLLNPATMLAGDLQEA